MSKSQSKSSKRRLTKRKHADKASMEERKSISHSTLEYFLRLLWRLWEIGRKLFSFGSSEDNKEPSLSLERPDAAASSSAITAPSGMSVAAEHASEEQTEGLAGQAISFGNVNDNGQSDYPNWPGHSNMVWTLDREGVDAEFSRGNGVMVGEIFCPYPDVCRRSNGDMAILPRVIEDDEIKSERPGSASGYRKKELDDLKKEHDDLKKELDDMKKEHDDLKKEHDDLKKKCYDLEKKSEVFENILQLRETLSRFIKEPEGKSRDDRLKEEVLKLPAAKCEKIDMILGKGSYSNSLRTMFFQGANMTLKSNFSSSDWREHHRFPKFSDGDADYQFWEENFDPKILERRMGIFREAAMNLDPDLDMFMIIKLVSELNSKLHPQPRENEFNETDEVQMSRLLMRARTLLPWWDSKI